MKTALGRGLKETLAPNSSPGKLCLSPSAEEEGTMAGVPRQGEGMAQDYVHRELNQEVTFIAGHYVLTKESRLPFRGRDLLYLVGYAIVDNSCCSVGGIAYAVVPGLVVSWQSKRNDDGLPVSVVEPVRDEELQREIERLVREKEIVSQVTFL